MDLNIFLSAGELLVAILALLVDFLHLQRK